jgi:hypothetical protein
VAHPTKRATEEVKMSKEMPSLTDVLGELETTAPENWWVSLEYNNYIAIVHPTFNDEQLIALGDMEGYFSFNDAIGNPVCGDMKGLTDAEEIAISFWQEVGKVYPDLIEKRKGISPEQLERVKKIITENKEKGE